MIKNANVFQDNYSNHTRPRLKPIPRIMDEYFENAQQKKALEKMMAMIIIDTGKINFENFFLRTMVALGTMRIVRTGAGVTVETSKRLTPRLHISHHQVRIIVTSSYHKYTMRFWRTLSIQHHIIQSESLQHHINILLSMTLSYCTSFTATI